MKRIFCLGVTLGLLLGSAGPVQGSDVTLPHTFEAGQPAVAAEVNENFAALADALNAAAVANLVVVSAVPGDAPASGQRLLDAMAAITDASTSNRYLIQLGPGDFNLQGVRLELKNHVSLAGMGEKVTRIFGSAANGVILGKGTVQIRDLQIQATGGLALVYNDGTIHLPGEGNVIRAMSNLMLRVKGANSVIPSYPTAGIRITGNTGMRVSETQIFLDGEGVRATSAVYVDNSTVQVRSVNIATVNDDGTGAGLFVQDGVLTVDESGMNGPFAYGLYLQGSSTAYVFRSHVRGDSAAVVVGESAELRIVSSGLGVGDGNWVSYDGGTVTCLFSYALGEWLPLTPDCLSLDYGMVP